MSQKLAIYQSLWGMELRSQHAPERTPEQTFEMVAEAGFDGMCLDPAVDEALLGYMEQRKSSFEDRDY